jgi:alpha-beta hydrolase superfamily lysophospholipase
VGAAALGLSALVMLACAPVVMPAGTQVTAPTLAADSLVMADGARLPLKSWLPQNGRPVAVILALHGFNDYSNFFQTAGSHLSDRQIAAYAYDQRGFGGAPHRGMWAGNDTLVDDLRQAARVVRGRHPGVPLFLLGESMGGAVVMAAMASAEPPEATGVILSAPAVWGRASMPWYQTVALWVASHTLPGSRVSGRGLGIQASDNVEMLKAQGRDPMVIKESRIDAVFGLVGLMDEAMAAAPRLKGRMLVLYGLRDQLIPEGAVREMLQRLPPTAAPRTVAYYENGWHMLLRDLQAEAVWRDLVSWIGRPGAPLPSGADQLAVAQGACPGVMVCAIVPSTTP